MKPQTRDKIFGLFVGTLLTSGFTLFIQGTHPVVILGIWVIACAGSTEGAIWGRANRRAAYGDNDREE